LVCGQPGTATRAPNLKEKDDAIHGDSEGDQDSEAGVLPDEKLLTEMGKFNDELVKAGIMLAVRGSAPELEGSARTLLGNETNRGRRSIRGNEGTGRGILAVKVKSKEEAIEWVKRCPNPMPGDSEIEIRQVFEAEDFGGEFTPELRAQEERQRKEIEKLAKSGKR
jgi:hypothetical protein